MIFANGDVIWQGRGRVAKLGVALSLVGRDKIRSLSLSRSTTIKRTFNALSASVFLEWCQAGLLAQQRLQIRITRTRFLL
jgi:hypothetical protein